MDHPHEGMSQMVDSPPRRSFYRRLVQRWKEFAIFNLNEKYKSRIARKSWDLWGIVAIGELFNWSGGLSSILFHNTTLHWPLFSFATTSSTIIFIATGCSADTCGPRYIPSSIWFKFQGCPVIVGQPFVANCSNFTAVGWCREKPDGHIYPL